MLKNRLIRKIKKLLLNFNEIDSKVKLCNNVKVVGSKLNSSVEIAHSSQISHSKLVGNKIEIGSSNSIKNSNISGYFKSGEHCKIVNCTLNGNITIGRYTSLWGPNLDIFTRDENVKIGNFCSIARNVSFQSYNHNHKKITTYFIGQNLFNENWENERVSKGDIILENDIWIGAHSVILGGVKINNGAIIAANSVVTKEVPAYSIVAGSPAKVIGYRFNDETIIKLQKMAWWDWSISKIKKNKELFFNELNEELIKNIYEE